MTGKRTVRFRNNEFEAEVGEAMELPSVPIRLYVSCGEAIIRITAELVLGVWKVYS